MTSAPFRRIYTKPIHTDLNILDVNYTFILEISKFMFKCKYDLLPIRFAYHFANIDASHSISYVLRSGVRKSHIVTRLLSSEKSIQIRGERIWSDIPDNIKQSASLITFKRLIKCMLFEN